MFIQQIQEGAVTRGVYFLRLGLFKWPETVVVTLDFLHFDVFVEIEPKFELALHYIVLHFAGNNGIFACFELVPQIHLSS